MKDIIPTTILRNHIQQSQSQNNRSPTKREASTFPGLELVDPPEGVSQGCPEAGDLVVLVVHLLLQVGNPVPQGLVLVLDHVV